MEPKSSQNRIRYTKEMKEAIAKIICQTQAYKRTERSKESKYQEVERTVAIHPAFRDLPNKPTAMAIEKEFKSKNRISLKLLNYKNTYIIYNL